MSDLSNVLSLKCQTNQMSDQSNVRPFNGQTNSLTRSIRDLTNRPDQSTWLDESTRPDQSRNMINPMINPYTCYDLETSLLSSCERKTSLAAFPAVPVSILNRIELIDQIEWPDELNDQTNQRAQFLDQTRPDESTRSIFYALINRIVAENGTTALHVTV